MLTFKQFLTERISTASIGRTVQKLIYNLFPKELEKFYKENVKHMSWFHYEKDPDYKISEAERKEDKKRTREYFEKFLKNIYEEEGNKEMKKWNGRFNGFRVWFEIPERNQGKADGVWYGSVRNMFINPKYMDDLVEAINDYLYQGFMDSGYDRSINCQLSTRMEDPLHRINEIFVHELAHAYQTHQEHEGAQSTYRSYLLKDKKKFYAYLDGAMQYKGFYYASPQEIEAFAQETVHRALHHTNHEDLDYEVQYLEDLIKYFDSTVNDNDERYKSMKDTNNKILQKVRKRFLKKVYVELVSVYDKAKEELADERKKAEQRQKDLEAEYT